MRPARVRSAIFSGALLCAAPALASVPIIDAARLDRNADIQAKKAQIKLIGDDRNKANKGVKCAVTTPKKDASSAVKDARPTASPAQGAGAIERFAPGATRPAAGGAGGSGSRAGVAAEQTGFDETGSVVGGQLATEGAIEGAKQTYQTVGGQIGSTTTVQQAFDQNSAVRVQNGLGWNHAIQVANLLTRALNLQNLASSSDVSRAAAGVVSPAAPGSTGGAGRQSCPIGSLGRGTQTDPCRPVACSTTNYGVNPDAGCVSRRYVDSVGNVIFYLSAEQLRLSPADVSAGLQQYQAR